MSRSLRTRIVRSYGILIVLVVVMLGTMFGTLVWNYYYSSAVGSVLQRAETESAIHTRMIAYEPLKAKARYMLQNMSEGTTHLQLLTSAGELVVDSNGLGANSGSDSNAVAGEPQAELTPDVDQAMKGKKGIWRGSDPVTGERIAAVTLPVMQGPRVVAMFRYTASLEEVDKTVRSILSITVLVGSFVVLLFFTMSVLIANRIAKPIRNLTRVAEKMAEGDWTRRAVHLHDRDEIGRLAETLNTMASELTRREKLKEDFISSISHELRTPLTSIRGWSETLASGDPGDVEELNMGLSIIGRETERLSGLVEDLLDFSKLYAKSIVLHPESLDIRRTIGETLRQFIARGHRESIRIIGKYSDEPLVAKVDANRLKQVFINVLDNALKFTPSGGTVTVTGERKSGEAHITIQDTGPGIPPEDLPHVTEKFYKGTSQRSGSGLGLAICKEIVELHGGQFQVSSAAGEGTTVLISIPLVPDEERQEPASD